ncbi:hypothetical protein [Xanthomonas sp. NCPPB 2632]|uniref:hypothetical protein n=1 Tax=Xanthomonas sp. NCPPB 2632 TaxID=3240912 RepID=UPI00351406F0
MARPFQLDGDSLILPNGRRVALDAIEDWAMAAWGGRQTIQTEKWRGWRIVQQYLVPPFKTIHNSGLHVNNVLAVAMEVENYMRDLKRVSGQR